MKAFKLIALTACAAMLLGSCNKLEVTPEPITRLDQALASYAKLDSAQQMQLSDSLSADIRAFFIVIGRPGNKPQHLLWWSESETVEAFQPAIDSVFPNLDKLEYELGYILAAAERDSLRLPQLSFAAVCWARPQPIVRVNKNVLIALNHYLGRDFEGYSHWQAFRRYEKSPEFIQYDLAAAILATQFPFQLKEPTLLHWMLYEGALAYIKMRLIDHADLAMAMGYTPEQLKTAQEYERQIWDEMAVRKLIYTTDPGIIDRLITPSPGTPLAEGKAPGRIARFIGYCIVEAYMHKNPKTKLVELLDPAFYANSQSLINSGY